MYSFILDRAGHWFTKCNTLVRAGHWFIKCITLVRQATSLLNVFLFTALNPYLIIHCEGQKVTSPFFWTEESKDHKLAAIFYRKKPEIMIKIEVRLTDLLRFKHYLLSSRTNCSLPSEC